ncbi:hypothetical protein PENTCL1PPCAC_24382, partial [Pristionchus entomophagus]
RMADSSNFILRWEINNPAAVYAASTDLDSQVLSEGGFEWIAGIRWVNAGSTNFDVILTCKNQRGGEWECKGDVSLVFIHSSNDVEGKDNLELNDCNCVHNFCSVGGTL